MTLREHLERCKARHSLREDTPYCDRCDAPWPCADHEDAAEALAILDAATPVGRCDDAGNPTSRDRLVRDPEPSAEMPA